MKGFQNIEYNDSLKCPFLGHEKIKEFNSQAGQDIFVLSVLNGKKEGVFLDIGCNEPKRINNTFLLEEKYNWKGILIDFADYHVSACENERRSDSMYICSDATIINYGELFNSFGIHEVIDYMSLDIDGIETLTTLKAIPFDDYKIRVITFEHDSYRFGDYIKEESRKFLKEKGYELICGDVKNGGCVYEDWYIKPELVDIDRCEILRAYSKEWSQIIFN
jgi:hypothetical protein